MSKQSSPQSSKKPSSPKGSAIPPIRQPRFHSQQEKTAAYDYDKHLGKLNKLARTWEDPIAKPSERVTNTINMMSDDARNAWNKIVWFTKNLRKTEKKINAIKNQLNSGNSNLSMNKLKTELVELEKQKKILKKDEAEYKYQLSKQPRLLEEHTAYRRSSQVAYKHNRDQGLINNKTLLPITHTSRSDWDKMSDLEDLDVDNLTYEQGEVDSLKEYQSRKEVDRFLSPEDKIAFNRLRVLNRKKNDVTQKSQDIAKQIAEYKKTLSANTLANIHKYGQVRREKQVQTTKGGNVTKKKRRQ
jgi:hypothetical protein